MPLVAVSCTYRGFIAAYARPFFPGHLVGTSVPEKAGRTVMAWAKSPY